MIYMFVFILFGINKFTIAEETAIYAVENTEFQDAKSASKVLSYFSNITMMDCSVHCLHEIRCMSFFYDDISNECQLHYVAFFERNNWAYGKDWKYYHVYSAFPNYDGYVENRRLNILYKLYKGQDMSIAQFNLTCTRDKGELLKITSQEIQDHIVDLLDDVNVEFVYIQGNDIANEGVWRYDNGTIMTYTNWSSDWIEQPEGDGDYLMLMKWDAYLWHDIHGVLPNSDFICQKSLQH